MAQPRWCFSMQGPHVLQPLCAHGGVGVGTMDAELADVDGGVVELRPSFGEGKGDVDAMGIPSCQTVLLHEELSGEGGFLLRGFWRRSRGWRGRGRRAGAGRRGRSRLRPGG